LPLMARATVATAFAAALVGWQGVAALDNGLGRLPPMGYNTWNDLGCAEMSEAGVKAAADALIKTGLRDLGYVYVNLDDCWHAPIRNLSSNQLMPDPLRFPSGLKALSSYVHDRGLRFGIYTDRGALTCAGRPGSLGHEELDAQTFADWGVDYVKEDNCFSTKGPNDQETLFAQFGKFRDSLNRTGRPIFFSVCGGGGQLPFSNLSYYATDSRGGEALANSWRVTSDCTDWHTCKFAFEVAGPLASNAVPGGLNDPDMLLGSSLACPRWLSPDRSRTQFSLWAILMAPMLLGTRISDLTPFDLETYSNSGVLAVSQDRLGKQGFCLSRADSRSVWGRPLAGGDWALLFLNDDWFFAADVVCDAACWDALAFPSGSLVFVRDLWQTGTLTQSQVTAGVGLAVLVDARGASIMLRLTPVTTSPTPVGTPRPEIPSLVV